MRTSFAFGSFLGACVCAVAVLAGCASNGNKPAAATPAKDTKTASTAKTSAGTDAAAKPAQSSTAASSASTTPSATSDSSTSSQTSTAGTTPFQEGFVAEFDKNSVALSKAALDYLGEISLSLHQAKSIEIRGYCDRKDNILGAQETALARATAVRSALVRLGVPAKKMRLMYNTTEARHSVKITLR